MNAERHLRTSNELNGLFAKILVIQSMLTERHSIKPDSYHAEDRNRNCILLGNP